MDRKNIIVLIFAIIVFGYLNVRGPSFPQTQNTFGTRLTTTPFPVPGLAQVILPDFQIYTTTSPTPSPRTLPIQTPSPLPAPTTTPSPSTLVSPPEKPPTAPQKPQGGIQRAGDDTLPASPSRTIEQVAMLLRSFEGDTLYASRADTLLPMASLTKLMTAAIVFEYGSLEDTVIISARAEGSEGDVATLREGEMFSTHALLEAMLIASSNDAAIAFEDYFAQKGLDLVSLMNERARTWNLQNTVFKNPTGLDETGHHSTARDLALLTRRLLEGTRYRTLWEITRKKEGVIVSSNKNLQHNFENSNKLLGEIPFIIGGKTGKTVRAKECLLLILNKNGKRYILVVLGSEDRFRDARSLIEKYF